ncbi:glycosyl hydrolase family 28 protein [Luteolibacter sp. SL250]|uniref:glycoside hydrolase family 28 protein n=1 Tax=Luteolibacter sp. SL250 TaxID=2995170 RepID=UPI002271A035|nr:glycosyl hydrolase family 28 protein [Luteolibacter sp. SL250]WAC19754.1 glycosyl hydrolase family 28 protein [Luteolibacter sp. SL250]
MKNLLPLVLALTTGFQLPARAAVTPYPRPIDDAASVQYQVKVDGVEVPGVQTVLGVGYAHFAFTGKVRIEVTSTEAIGKFELSPHRLNLPVQTNGNTLTFEIAKPCKLQLRINDGQRFFIFADPEETNAPKAGDQGVRLLTELGVPPSNEKVQTGQFQKAINLVAGEKGTLVVPAGIYRTGTLNLPDGLSLYLAPGSLIKGTADPKDYISTGEEAQLLMKDAQDVRIYGRGVIDNNGMALRKVIGGKKSSTRMLATKNSRNLVMEDVILRDAAIWCIHPMQSSDMQFRNLKIISMTRAESGPDDGYNTDGFDPDNSSNITIENNFISVDDDAIAVKLNRGSERKDMSRIVFRDNVVFTMCSALKIGTEVMGGFTVRDVLFENNDILHADIGISLYCYRGGYAENIRWIGNHFEKTAVLPDNSPHHHFCNIYINTRSTEGFGGAKNLLIKDNTFENYGPKPSGVRAKGQKQFVDGVIIENLAIGGKTVKSPEEAKLNVDKEVRNLRFVE